MSDPKLNTPVGDKDAERLKEMPVVIVSVRIAAQESEGTTIGEKVIFTCKHPDKEENIIISKAKYIRDKKITESGLWYKLDSENKLAKNSALGLVLAYYKLKSLSDSIGMEFPTELDENGYLCFKAY